MTQVLLLQSLKEKQLAQLTAQFPQVEFLTEVPVKTALKNINVLFGYRKTVLDQILAGPHQLQWIQSISAGVDYFPLTTLKQQHILLSNTSGIHAQPIAEWVLGTLLSYYRGILTAQTRQGQHDWQRRPDELAELGNRHLLIFGTGHIGQRIATLASAFGATVTGVNHSGHSAPGFDHTVAMANSTATLAQADVIINALPLTPATTDYFNHTFFNQLTTQPVFVNIGRGPSVNEADLQQALNQQQLQFAALDVQQTEPLPADSPLWQQANLLISPHISGIVEHFKAAVYPILVNNLTQFLKDGTLAERQVNLDQGY